jgi:hypothetical protein
MILIITNSVDREGISTEKRIELEEEKKVALKMLEKLSRKDEEIDNERLLYLRKLISNPKMDYYEYEEEKKRRIQKIKQSRQDFVDFVRYKPNYNAIYPTVYAVKMFKPVYHKDNEINSLNNNNVNNTDLKVPKNVSFIKEDIYNNNNKHNMSYVSSLKKDKLVHSRSCKSIQDNETNIHNKMLLHNEDSNNNSNSYNNNNSSDKVIKKDLIKIHQQPKKKKNHYRTQKIDPSLIKTISFEKTSGRDNKLKERRKQLDKFIGYSPNYDFIRKDTTKTCT